MAAIPHPDIWTVPASRLMNRRVISVRADMPIEDVGHLLVEHAIGGAPVVDDGDIPIGMVTKTDLLRRYCNPGQRTQAHQVSDIMTPAVLTVPESAPLGDVADLMMRAGVHRVVAVDRTGKVAGILSSIDVVKFIARGGHPAEA